MIRWIFFDVGSVLFNDAPQDFLALCAFHRRVAAKDPNVDFRSFLNRREELAREGGPMILARLVGEYLNPDEIRETYRQARDEIFPRYDHNNLPFDGLLDTLESAGRDFPLGIIANQPTQCRQSLERRGLLAHFQVVGISDELGMKKPDPKFFRWAIDQAGIAADEAIMVGDRLDNDIVPAAEIGMKTIWLDWPGHHAKNWFPTDPEAIAFLESTDRVPIYGPRPDEDSNADRTVHDLTDVPAAVRSLCS